MFALIKHVLARKNKIIVIHTSPLQQKNKSVVKRLPPKQKVINNFFFESEISAIAPRTGADKKTIKAVVPERKAHMVVAFVDISKLPSLKNHPLEGTMTEAKYIGKSPAMTVVANAELAQSYIYQAKRVLFFL